MSTQDDISTECDAIKAMLLQKNEQYGDSALNPVRIMSSSGPVEQLMVRIDDKLSRLSRGTPGDDEDTVQDLIGYLILLRVARKRMGAKPDVPFPMTSEEVVKELRGAATIINKPSKADSVQWKTIEEVVNENWSGAASHRCQAMEGSDRCWLVKNHAEDHRFLPKDQDRLTVRVDVGDRQRGQAKVLEVIPPAVNVVVTDEIKAVMKMVLEKIGQEKGAVDEYGTLKAFCATLGVNP